MGEQRPRKLLDGVRGAIRLKHESIRTGEADANWIERTIFFHGVRHRRRGLASRQATLAEYDGFFAVQHVQHPAGDEIQV